MGLRDFFKPKWMHKNPQIRARAITTDLKEQNILADIAKNDEEECCRVAAIQKLDPEQWKDLLRGFVDQGTEDVQMAAFERLNSPEILKEVALSEEKWFSMRLREAAVRKLYDQDVLAAIAKEGKEDRNLRLIAIKKLGKDKWKSFFADIAFIEENPMIQSQVMKKIYDTNILSDLAEHAKHPNTRILAIKKLGLKKWGKLLNHLAKNDENDEVRKEAMKILNREAAEASKKTHVLSSAHAPSEKDAHYCARCDKELNTKRYIPGGIIFGSEGYEKHQQRVASSISGMAYKCRACGNLQCRSCAEIHPCANCGNRVFDIFITSDR